MINIILTSGFWIVLIIFFVKNPEKVEKWIGILSRFLGFICKKYEYFSIKHEVQGKINSFVANLEENTVAKFSRVIIKWTASKDEEDIEFNDLETVILMRDNKHVNKNFVHAAYFYTSKVFLSKAKKHLPVNLKTSLDLFTTDKLLKKESKGAVDQFEKDFFIKEMDSSAEIKNYIKKYINIDRLGIYFPVFIQELNFLGKKVFLEDNSREVTEEINQLIDFLETRANREVGELVPETFAGKFTKCSIKVVASKTSRLFNQVDEQKERILKAIKNGCENIYIMGDAEDESRNFVDRVIKDLIMDKIKISIEKRVVFDSEIYTHDGKRKKVKTYFIHINNPLAIDNIRIK